jgi:hypothetical protein
MGILQNVGACCAFNFLDEFFNLLIRIVHLLVNRNWIAGVCLKSLVYGQFHGFARPREN